MNVTIAELESYLLDHYENGGIDESLDVYKRQVQSGALCLFLQVR